MTTAPSAPRTPEDAARTGGLTALGCAAIGPIAWPAALLAPLVALAALARVRAARRALPDPVATARPARWALAIGTLQIALFAGYAWMVLEILAG